MATEVFQAFQPVQTPNYQQAPPAAVPPPPAALGNGGKDKHLNNLAKGQFNLGKGKKSGGKGY